MITDKNFSDKKKELRLFLAGEIGKYINRAGSAENLSLLLDRSETYVRMILKRKATTERLENLWNECKEKIK